MPAELIFVFAGRMERKHYGLELLRNGAAGSLVISVARYEVSKMPALGLPCTSELIALRDRTPPRERHYFVTVTASDCNFRKAALVSWNTYGEVMSLGELIRDYAAHEVMLVSAGMHLRRISLLCGALLRDVPVKFTYQPVPHSPESRWDLLKENTKRVVYRLLIKLPPHFLRRLMMCIK